MSASKEEIQAVEEQLDAALAQKPTLAFDANAALAGAVEFTEAATAREPMGGVASALSLGITIFAPHFVSGTIGDAVQHEALVEDLVFGSHYFHVRELLYYAYNAEGSVDWTVRGNDVRIRYSDPTLPRQFFTAWNDVALGSLEHFANRDQPDKIRKLVKGRPEFEMSPEIEAAQALLDEEADHKIAAYFSILRSAGDVDLGGYTYSEFLRVYKVLLQKALYHRYHAEVNAITGPVCFNDGELEAALAHEGVVAVDTAKQVLRDIVYDKRAASERIDASYFSLMREGGGGRRLVMRPFHFSTAEGLVQHLRVVATRRPQHFLSHVSNDLGALFVERVKSAFEQQGFHCKRDVSLREFDPSLPDADLIVVSEEPTLGYVLFFCEVKSPIPPIWAKDQLRALAPDSVSKAFRQAEAVRRFLDTDIGIKFVRNLLPSEGIPHFDGFIVLIKQLIITSDNAGMFFGHETTPVMAFRTLERLLHRSDGDMALVMAGIEGYTGEVDSLVRTTVQTFTLGDVSIAYESVIPGPLLDFPQGSWRSSDARKKIIEDFIADGHHPFDSIPGLRPPSARDKR